MLRGIKNRGILRLVFGVWLMERFALFEVGSIPILVYHRAYTCTH